MIKVSFVTLLRVWWIFAWRGALLGFLLGALAGFCVDIFAYTTGSLSQDQVFQWGKILGGIAGFISGFVVLYYVFNKQKFGNLKISVEVLDKEK